MFIKSKKKANRKQVNMRLPQFIIDHVEEACEALGMTRNDYYVAMLYNYLLYMGIKIPKD